MCLGFVVSVFNSRLKIVYRYMVLEKKDGVLNL